MLPLTSSLVIMMALLAPVMTGDLAPDIGVETRYRDDEWVISSVTLGGLANQAGLRAGDVVEALDGTAPGRRRLTSPSLDVRGVHAWRVSRAGEHLELNMNLASAPLETRLEPLVLLTLALVFWGSALIVQLSKPLDSIGRRYWRLSVATALAVELAPAAARDSLWAKPVEVIAFAIAPAFFFDFCAGLAPARPTTDCWLARLLAGGGLAAGLVYLVGGYLGAWFYDTSRNLLLIGLVAGSIAGIGMLVRGYWHPPSARARHQIEIIFFGAAAGALPITMLSAIPEGLGQASLVRPQVAAIALIALPLAVAYAIVRHQLLEIDVVLSRTLVYTLMALLLAGGYALVLEVPSLLTIGKVETMSPALTVVFFAVVTLSFIPVHNRLRYLTDHLVYRDRYNHVHFLRERAAQLASVAPIDDVLPKITQSIAEAMNLRGAAVLLQQTDGTLAVRAASGACARPAYADKLITRGVALRGGGGFDDAEAGHWLPLVAHGEDAGLLYLGAKRTRAPLGAEDLSVAQTIASNAAISVANALLVERLRTKVAEHELLRDRLLHVQQAERKRLAQDLHDGALHTLLALVRQAEALIEKVSSTDGADRPQLHMHIRAIAERGRDAAFELRATCSDLYPSELEHLGLVAALESLAEARSVTEDLEVTFTRLSFPAECRLPEVVEDTIYRVAREALDNVIQHAGARRAAIELRLEPAAVVLSIQDDGQGFAAPISSVALLRSGHFGLATMRERVERLGGSLDITSERSSGARLHVRVPSTPVASTLEAQPA